MEIPESLSIKAKSTHTIPLGKVYFDIEDYLTTKDVQDMIRGAGQDFMVYDHFREDDLKSYLLHLPLQSFDLDVGNMFGDILNATDFSAINFQKSFSVPCLDTGLSKTLFFDISNYIFEVFDATLPLPIMTAGGEGQIQIKQNATAPQIEAPAFPLSCDGLYESLSFASGSLKVEIQPPATQTQEADFTLELEVSIQDDTKKVIAKSDLCNATNGSTITVPLDNVTLPSNVLVVLQGKVTGGGENVLHNYSVQVALSNDTVLKTIQKFNLGGLRVPLDFALDLSSLDNIYSLQIEQGSLQVLGNIPHSTGINTQIDRFETTGALESQKTDWTFAADVLLSATLDLSGKTIKPQNIDFAFSVAFDFADANLVFNDKGELPIDINAALCVNKIASATIKMQTGELGVCMNLIMPMLSCDMIKRVSFKKDDIKVFGSIYNGLPEGNDIGLSTNCPDFLITGQKTFAPALNTQEPQAESFEFSNQVPQNDSIQEAQRRLEFSPLPQSFLIEVGLSLPNQATIDGVDTFTINNIVPNVEYSIKTSVNFDFSYDSVTFDAGAIGQKEYAGSLEVNVGIDEIFSGLDDNIKDAINLDAIYLKSFPINVYCIKPDFNAHAFDSLKIKASANISSTDPDIQLIPKDTPLEFVDALPEFTSLGVWGDLPPESWQDTQSLVTLINKRAKDIVLNYNIGIDTTQSQEITVYKSDLDALPPDATTKLQISLVLELPLEFALKQDLEIDVLSLAGNTQEDLLGRESVDDWDYQKILDVIEEIDFNFIVDNNLVKGFDSTLYMINYHYFDSPKFVKLASNGSGAISLNREEAQKILSSWPFCPDLVYIIQESDQICVLQTSDNAPKRYALVPQIKLKVNGKYEIWNKNSDSDNSE